MSRAIVILSITATVLMVPLIAMQFTSEVNWDLVDFAVAGALLISTGLLVNWFTTRVTQLKYRVVIYVVLILALVVIWAELAVGILGTPFSGS